MNAGICSVGLHDDDADDEQRDRADLHERAEVVARRRAAARPAAPTRRSRRSPSAIDDLVRRQREAVRPAHELGDVLADDHRQQQHR